MTPLYNAEGYHESCVSQGTCNSQSSKCAVGDLGMRKVEKAAVALSQLSPIYHLRLPMGMLLALAEDRSARG
ncbi:unnamed protein product [Clonostachys rhizophaga]|uniref:Uncharacterized protein n=1 Tax=Clonostachys rhizophaga TaxID=160324 RepID=A0A9N9YHM1_9HYPO|nr:unnamed protein product [Clonostachys rhizophaga]